MAERGTVGATVGSNGMAVGRGFAVRAGAGKGCWATETEESVITVATVAIATRISNIRLTGTRIRYRLTIKDS